MRCADLSIIRMPENSDLENTIREELILLDVKAEDKVDAFRQMVDLLAARGLLTEPKAFLDEVLEREDDEPTGIGRGVAIPHGRTQYLNEEVVVIARLRDPIKYRAIDTQPVQMLFLFGTPEQGPEHYLQLLGQLCTMLRVETIRHDLLNARTPREVKQILIDGLREQL